MLVFIFVSGIESISVGSTMGGKSRRGTDHLIYKYVRNYTLIITYYIPHTKNLALR